MLYLCNDKAADVETTLLFKERKVTTHVPSKLTNVFAYGVALGPTHPSKILYKGMLPQFIYAGLRGQHIVMDGTNEYVHRSSILNVTKFTDRWFNLQRAATTPSGVLSWPKIGVFFRGKVTQNWKETLERGGFDLHEEKRTETYVGYPHRDIYAAILNQTENPYNPSHDTPVTPGMTNIRGMTTLIRTIKTLLYFLDVNTWANSVSTDGLVNIVSRISDDDPFPYAVLNELRYTATVAPEFADAAYKDNVKYSMKNMAVLARPVPTYKDRPLAGSGSTSRIPCKSGIVAPYFKGMNVYSRGIAERLMTRYFLHTFGDTAETAMAEYFLYRRGWETLASTDAGMSMQHLAYLTEIAIDAGVCLYAVFEDGLYLGGILYYPGDGFCVTIMGRTLKPLVGEEFQAAIQGFSGHKQALRDICKIVSGCSLKESTDDGETSLVVDPTKIRFARQLYREVSKRKVAADTKVELKPLVEKLNFGQGFLPMTAENLAWMVEVAAGDADYDIDTPMWIQGNGLYSSDQFRYACSAFGPTAPSFMMTSGVPIKIARIEAEDPTTEINPKTGRELMNFVAVVMKPVQIAASDLAMVFESKKVKVKYAPRGTGPAKASYVFNGPAKKVIWEALRKNVHPVNKPRGPKRALEDRDNVDKEAVAKKAKLDADSAMAALF